MVVCRGVKYATMSVNNRRVLGLWPVIGLFLIAAGPAFAQAGGEVIDAKVTHFESSIGAPTPPDEVKLRLRVVDERGHDFTWDYELNESDAKRWLAEGEERRLLLIDHYISMFQQLDADVARGKIAPADAKIDQKKAQGYITLADIAAVVKSRAAAKADAGAAKSIAKKCNPPQVIRRVEPKYTNEARKARYQGIVTLEVIVLADGSVDILRIARRLGFGLDENAVAAVKQWKFAPRPEDCPKAFTVDVTFSLR